MITLEHLQKALDLIDANDLPEGRKWSQEHWDCGTACCIHGVAHLLAYNKPTEGPPSHRDYPEIEPHGLRALFYSVGTTPHLMRQFLNGDFQLGKNCKIYPNVSIGTGVVIAEGVTLGSYVTIGDNVFIGRYTTVDYKVTIAPGLEIPPRSMVSDDIENQKQAYQVRKQW